MAEHEEVGVGEFCRTYGFSLERSTVVREGKKRYGARVLLAAAHGRLPGHQPLAPHAVPDDDTVKATLEQLGFDVGQVQPPTWTRDELVLACSLLFNNGQRALHASHPRVVELSGQLKSMRIHRPEDRGGNFRSPGSVQFKLYNLSTALPTYTGAETKGGNLDSVILREFLADEVAMQAEAKRIRESLQDRIAWSVFSSEERKYGGNAGYGDELGVQYVYDNNVGYSRRLAVGDLIVVRDHSEVHGVGRIHRIDLQENVEKLRLACPECRSTRFERRKKQRPQYLCRVADCRHEFDEPAQETTFVTQYTARYGRSWQPLDGAISLDDHKQGFLDDAKQNAIRPLSATLLEEQLQALSVPPPPEPDPEDAYADRPIRGGHRATTSKGRIGQDAFRSELLKKYGAVCAVTGPCALKALDAAHLDPFAKSESHDTTKGVLLRADIHRLFDAGLITVDPDTWQVVIAESLTTIETYARLEGASFIVGPDQATVHQHFELTTAAWR